MPVRIAVFTDSWYPYVSGVVRSIDTFREQLRVQGHEVLIFAPSYRRQEPEPDVFRFPALPAPTNAGFALALPFAPRVGRMLRELSVDVVHCHSPFLLGGVGARWARSLQLPLVFTHHTLYDLYTHYVPLFPGLAKKVVLGFARRFCNGCDLVITPTLVVANRLRNLGITVPLKAIPTGIKLEEFQGADPQWLRGQLGLSAADRIVLCVARLGPEKNLELLLKSFRLIQREVPAAHLVVVGLGPLRAELERSAAGMGLATRVHFVDRVLTRREITNCYTGADLFLFASVTETQGIIINEAQAAGLPVVAVRAFGVAEMVQEGQDGFLTDENAEALAAPAVQVLQDEALHARLREGAWKAAQCISAEAVTRELVSTYRHLASGGKTAVTVSPGLRF